MALGVPHALASEQPDEAPAGHEIVGSEANNGSFETGAAPWRGRGYQMASFQAEVIPATEQLPAVSGDHLFQVTAVGGDEMRLNARLDMNAQHVDLANGRHFLVTFNARSRSVTNEFSHMNVTVVLWDGETKKPALVKASPLVPLEESAWTETTYEFSVDPALEADRLEIRLQVIRPKASGLTEGRGYFDHVSVRQTPAEEKS